MGPRILIVNVNWVGDVLLSTPAIRALRKKYPQAFIACLVPSRCRAILLHNPHLNEVLTFDENRSLPAFFGNLALPAVLRQRRFDTAILFHRSKTKAWWMRLAGIRERLGFDGGFRRHWLTKVCPRPTAPLHRADIFIRLVEYFGVPADGRTPDFVPDRGAETALRRLFETHGLDWEKPYVTVHAGGNWALKRWPADYFVEWIRLFLKQKPWRVILCGTDSEKPLCEDIRSHFPPEAVVSLCGETSLDTLALLLGRAEMLLSNDSGPIHLAASQRTKILGLFGPTDPDQTGPISEVRSILLRRDVGCKVPCYFRSCNARFCMEWLKPEEVMEEARKLMTHPPSLGH